MFEMFVTITAALAATVYGFSQSVFMNGPHSHLYRIALLTFIIIYVLIYRIYHRVKNAHILKMHVNLEDYLYYEKYTSLLYRIGYFLSYLIQNILFDYTYMKRNFNFCKGLDVYDGGVSEYYIKFRNTWYKYLSLTLARHRVSLRKLQAFASNMKNDMIVNALGSDEEKAIYDVFTKTVDTYFLEHHAMSNSILKTFDNYSCITRYYRKNLLKVYHVKLYVEKHEPKIFDLVERKNFRNKRDVNDYKKMNLK